MVSMCQLSRRSASSSAGSHRPRSNAAGARRRGAQRTRSSSGGSSCEPRRWAFPRCAWMSRRTSRSAARTRLDGEPVRTCRRQDASHRALVLRSAARRASPPRSRPDPEDGDLRGLRPSLCRDLRRALDHSPVGRSLRGVHERLDHGHEPRAEEIALHQRFLTLQNQMEAASDEGDEREIRRLRPLLERARKRWIAANMRVTRNR